MTSSSFVLPTNSSLSRLLSPRSVGRRAPRLRIVMVSTYPPKLCGLATFAAALSSGLEAAGHHVEIARVVDDETSPSGSRQPGDRQIIGDLRPTDRASIAHIARILSTADVAVIQHEFGIFGGVDGDDVLALTEQTRTPLIVVLHTVPLHPSPRQAFILERLAERAERLVVMTDAARKRLLALYEVDEHRIETIPHGAALPLYDASDSVESAPQLLTWGLLGPGKGIEHAIAAVAELAQRGIATHYTIAGVTHPKVLSRNGEAYRQSLRSQAAAAGVSLQVNFDETYRSVPQLTRFVASSSIVVLPYESTDQVTSGVLVDAIAAGRPVIATAFPHAVELLGTGAGIVVPHQDPSALADAIASLVTDPQRLQSMAAEANRLAPSLSWSAIGAEYGAVAESLVSMAAAVGE